MLFVAEEVRTIIAALGILDWRRIRLDSHLYEEVRLWFENQKWNIDL